MSRLEESILIAAPPERVWDVVQDYDRRGAWDTRVVSADSLTGPPLGVGSRVRYRFRGMLGLRFWMEAAYLVYRTARQSAVKFDRVSAFSPIAGAAGTWRLVPEGEGTRFHTTFSYELKGGWCGRLFDRHFATKAAREETARSLANLKALVESGGSSPPRTKCVLSET